MQSSRHVLRVTDADSDPQGCYTLKFSIRERSKCIDFIVDGMSALRR